MVGIRLSPVSLGVVTVATASSSIEESGVERACDERTPLVEFFKLFFSSICVKRGDFVPRLFEGLGTRGLGARYVSIIFSMEEFPAPVLLWRMSRDRFAMSFSLSGPITSWRLRFRSTDFRGSTPGDGGYPDRMSLSTSASN